MTTIYPPTSENIKQAKQILVNGGVVAFPTETVYGLGANALDEHAVSSIFAIKGRPQDNPIIIHVGEKNQITDYAHISNPIEQTIIDTLMPGPLTILLEKKNIVPDMITAGRNLVGVRIPSHTVALDLLNICDFPIAAPSANISTKPSPTSAQMVYANFGDRIPMIIDGDSAAIGIESTVVKVENNEIIITRPGFVTKEDIEDLFDGKVIVSYATKPSQETPGNKYKHYSPSARVTIISSVQDIDPILAKTCLIATEEFISENKSYIDTLSDLTVFVRGTEKNLATCAHSLFAIYHQCDQEHLEHIFIQALPEVGIGFSIMNRVKKSVTISTE